MEIGSFGAIWSVVQGSCEWTLADKSDITDLNEGEPDIPVG